MGGGTQVASRPQQIGGGCTEGNPIRHFRIKNDGSFQNGTQTVFGTHLTGSALGLIRNIKATVLAFDPAPERDDQADTVLCQLSKDFSPDTVVAVAPRYLFVYSSSALTQLRVVPVRIRLVAFFICVRMSFTLSSIFEYSLPLKRPAAALDPVFRRPDASHPSIGFSARARFDKR